MIIEGRPLQAGHLAVLGPGPDALHLDVPTSVKLLVLGGTPFPEPLMMWWNFVARTRAEIDQARADWQDRTGRFGPVISSLDVLPAPHSPWTAGS